jgi:hypothetical protein
LEPAFLCAELSFTRAEKSHFNAAKQLDDVASRFAPRSCYAVRCTKTSSSPESESTLPRLEPQALFDSEIRIVTDAQTRNPDTQVLPRSAVNSYYDSLEKTEQEEHYEAMHREKLANSKQQSLSSYFSHLGQKYRTQYMVRRQATLEPSILSSGILAVAMVADFKL